MKLLPLTKGKFVKIDDEDFVWVSKYKLFASAHKSNYASYCVLKEGKWKSILLHRTLAKAKKGQIVDHINGDTLDCRKANLRVVKQRTNVVSGIKVTRAIGAYLDKRRGVWNSRIRISPTKRIHLGSYKTKDEASSAYKLAVQKHHAKHFGNKTNN